jgi:hypothetical protein
MVAPGNTVTLETPFKLVAVIDLAHASNIVNALLTADVSPLLDAVRLLEPDWLILRSLKVARPLAFVI